MCKDDVLLRKIIFLIVIFMISIVILIARIFSISTNQSLNNNKDFYKLKIHGQRGMIYDCNNIPLVENENKIFVSVIPNKENFVKIINNVSDDQRVRFVKKFKKNLPFICEVNKNIKYNNLKTFKIPIRSKKYNKSCHIVGYVSDENFGVSGIEKAFDDTHIMEEFQAGAMNKLLEVMHGKHEN